MSDATNPYQFLFCSVSSQEEKKKDGAELVDCDHHVSVADINRVYHEKKTDMSENSQKIFTKSVELVAKTDDYIMRDCELTMRENSRLYVIFFAGSLANKYSVTVVSGIVTLV